ncbi:MAG TPA: transglycosylase SLT domain-containing protein, partial [Anaerolineae bacterium]|nr:transglycosylase SLT domain-containing protein [Anaerolineae bacterium]
MKLGLRVTLAILIVTMVVGLASPVPAQAENTVLCSYWQPNITQWADLITKYSADNGLDPNFVASLIQEESQGNPRLISRAGAVGLMQIMPYEVGFTWRPRTWKLLDPEANLEWGTNTLSEVIRQAQGRLTLAVLAYNSGWDRIQL